LRIDEQGTPAPDPSEPTPCGARGARHVAPCASSRWA